MFQFNIVCIWEKKNTFVLFQSNIVSIWEKTSTFVLFQFNVVLGKKNTFVLFQFKIVCIWEKKGWQKIIWVTNIVVQVLQSRDIISTRKKTEMMFNQKTLCLTRKHNVFWVNESLYKFYISCLSSKEGNVMAMIIRCIDVMGCKMWTKVPNKQRNKKSCI